MRVNGMRSLFSFSAVCSADCRRLLDVSVTVYGIFESVSNWFLAVLNVFLRFIKSVY